MNYFVQWFFDSSFLILLVLMGVISTCVSIKYVSVGWCGVVIICEWHV